MMKRLTVSVDDVATLRYLLNDSDFDPVHFAILCEVSGALGISATLTESQQGIQECDAVLLKRVYKTFLNLHIPPEPAFIKSALSISPDMVTFVDVARTEKKQITPLPGEFAAERLPNILPDFQANNISVAVYSEPEILVLKQLSKVAIDYVEFDCTEFTTASDSNEEIVALDKLRNATLAAVKLGLGVNSYGRIQYGHLPMLAEIPRLEDVCLGVSALKKAMLVGVEKAIREARELLYFHQKD